MRSLSPRRSGRLRGSFRKSERSRRGQSPYHRRSTDLAEVRSRQSRQSEAKHLGSDGDGLASVRSEDKMLDSPRGLREGAPEAAPAEPLVQRLFDESQQSPSGQKARDSQQLDSLDRVRTFGPTEKTLLSLLPPVTLGGTSAFNQN